MPRRSIYLGLMYTEGKGTWKDDTQALRWYRLAANRTSPPPKRRSAGRSKTAAAWMRMPLRR